MWNSCHNSYFHWKIVNGGVSANGRGHRRGTRYLPGAYFCRQAPEEQLHYKWQAFNSGGVTYASRATQMLQSIHTNMTQNNYFLPGDNWAGTGLSNMDPSYFATGYLRVFDQYQTTYQFTPVACNLLSRCSNPGARNTPRARRPTGAPAPAARQATRPSGQTYQGLGMTDDAIRTPWRICMDALWFNNADAKTFCSNSRNTLTQYVNVTLDQ